MSANHCQHCFDAGLRFRRRNADPQWQQIVAAAKKEGKVVVSIPAGAELRKSLKDRFEKRYGIELELFTGRGAAVAKKIADEFRAGLRLTDIYTGGSGPIIFALTDMLEPVESQFILPDGRSMVVVREGIDLYHY